MERICTSVLSLIGRTPLVEVRHTDGLSARLLVKLEAHNPAGSAKDRAALSMIQDAEARGLLRPGGAIIEPTSGNTGIAFAAIAAARGYRCTIVMPDSFSIERRRLITAYGAELVLTPGADGMRGAAELAASLACKTPGSFLPNQFSNPANAAAHYRTTGPEVWADTDGKIDIFVAGVGTGGTITGAGRYLKAQKPGIFIAAVEPAESPLLSGGAAGPHGIEGIGANFIPSLLDRTVYDAVVPVTTADARAAARHLARQEGILAGISSGAALYAAAILAARPENRGKTVVALLPDTGTRCLSAGIFD